MNREVRSLILKYSKNPKLIIKYLNSKGVFNFLPDKLYLKFMFRINMGSNLNLKNPQTFNEKLQWLKLHDRKPIYTTMVDKCEAKKLVASIIGEEYIIPTLGVWDRFDDIDFDALPNQFVLKCTHDSGGLVICRNKREFDIDAARRKMNKSMRTNYYLQNREWPYKNVKPRIIAEKYMSDIGSDELRDYKFFCFGGEARCFKVDFERFIEHHANYYDIEKNALNFGEIVCPPVFDRLIELPDNLEAMRDLAEKLSANTPFLRADFYDVSGEIYFGELTFYPASGMGRFTSDEWDNKLGKWIKLPNIAGGGYILIDSDVVIYYTSVDFTDRLIDYKFYCFNGEPMYLYVSRGLEDHTTASISFLTLDWTFAPFGRSDYKSFNHIPAKPSQFEKMIFIAKKLSDGYKFLRVDLYEVKNQIYFSELTFSPCSGYMPFDPPEWDEILGMLLKL